MIDPISATVIAYVGGLILGRTARQNHDGGNCTEDGDYDAIDKQQREMYKRHHGKYPEEK